MKRIPLLAGCLVAALAASGGVTLDETFTAGLVIGPEGSGRSWDAKALVGDNRGSVFFDVSFRKPENHVAAQRTLVRLRTAGRLTLAWNAYKNETLQCELTDQSKTYRVTFKERKIELGKTYGLGVTWDGDAVRV